MTKRLCKLPARVYRTSNFVVAHPVTVKAAFAMTRNTVRAMLY